MKEIERSLADNIRTRREELRLKKAEVAKASKISLMAYLNIENGKSMPKDETLANIAYALDINIDDLWKKKGSAEEVRFRANPKLLIRGRILEETQLYAKFLAKISDGENENMSSNKRFNDFVSDIKMRNLRPKEAALKLREHWNIRTDAVDDLLYILDENGIELYSFKALTEYFKSFSGRYDEIGNMIVFNSWEVLNVEDIVFNIVHELGHLVLHPYVYDVFESDTDVKEDKEADEFASYFLLPDECLAKYWNCYKNLPLLERVMAVKHRFSVSWRLVAKHVGNLMGYDCLSLLEDRFANNGINLHVYPEPEPLPREKLIKDGCKESYISKTITKNIKKIGLKEIETFFSRKDSDNIRKKYLTERNLNLLKNYENVEKQRLL